MKAGKAIGKRQAAKEGLPILTFVVTCKGRLEHLKQSLPMLLCQPSSKTIVVEVECPDGSAEWVATHHPDAQLIRHTDGLPFSLPRARNAGLAQVATPWVCFIDADIVVDSSFAAKVFAQLEPNAYFVFDSRKGKPIGGTVLVETTTARILGGYDATFEGWGAEDTEFYDRLRHAGIAKRELSSDCLRQVINHHTNLRTQYYAERNIAISATTNDLYRLIKRNLRRLGLDNIEDDESRRLFYRVAKEAVARAISSQDREVEFEIALPMDPSQRFFYASVDTSIKIRLRLPLPGSAV